MTHAQAGAGDADRPAIPWALLLPDAQDRERHRLFGAAPAQRLLHPFPRHHRVRDAGHTPLPLAQPLLRLPRVFALHHVPGFGVWS